MPKKIASVRYDDKIWKQILSRVSKVGKIFAHVGVFADGGATEDGFAMVELAAIHEFGSEDGRIPERSWIRAAMRKAHETGEMAKICSSICQQIIRGELDTERGIKLLGEWAVAYIRKFVTEGEHIPPPLKQGTIDAKGSDRPLVDTGAMINSLTYVVSEGGE